jgi:glycosyltransferase involved in cell wall biosynthesis
MDMGPLVSVIIIFLNGEKFIREAIASVFAQTYTNWELILVDDGSTDQSSEIARRCAEECSGRVRYIQHTDHENHGASASRNLGLKNARGEYIAFLDVDDIWLPQKLERQTAIMRSHPEVGMVYGATRYWHSWTGNTEDLHRDYAPKLGIQTNMVFPPPALLRLLYPLGLATAPCPSDIFVRHEVADRTGGFEEAFIGAYQLYEDQAFLAKIYLETPVFVANECWDNYRVHPESCVSRVTGSGLHGLVEEFYLDWLEQYFLQRRVKDRGLWKALRRKQRYHRYPRWSQVVDRARYGLTQMTNFLNGTAWRSG